MFLICLFDCVFVFIDCDGLGTVICHYSRPFGSSDERYIWKLDFVVNYSVTFKLVRAVHPNAKTEKQL